MLQTAIWNFFFNRKLVKREIREIVSSRCGVITKTSCVTGAPPVGAKFKLANHNFRIFGTLAHSNATYLFIILTLSMWPIQIYLVFYEIRYIFYVIYLKQQRSELWLFGPPLDTQLKVRALAVWPSTRLNYNWVFSSIIMSLYRRKCHWNSNGDRFSLSIDE